MSDELPNLGYTRAAGDRSPTDRQNGTRINRKAGSAFPPTTINPLGTPPLPMTKSLSRHPSQPPEDWDHPESMVDSSSVTSTSAPMTSRVVFPSQGGAAAADPDAPTPDALPSHSHRGGRAGKRTLSEVLKLHAEKGTDVHFTSEEANRLEDLLGQWVRPFFFFSL